METDSVWDNRAAQGSEAPTPSDSRSTVAARAGLGIAGQAITSPPPPPHQQERRGEHRADHRGDQKRHGGERHQRQHGQRERGHHEDEHSRAAPRSDSPPTNSKPDRVSDALAWTLLFSLRWP
jgi:hypothetical protein